MEESEADEGRNSREDGGARRDSDLPPKLIIRDVLEIRSKRKEPIEEIGRISADRGADDGGKRRKGGLLRDFVLETVEPLGELQVARSRTN